MGGTIEVESELGQGSCLVIMNLKVVKPISFSGRPQAKRRLDENILKECDSCV